MTVPDLKRSVDDFEEQGGRWPVAFGPLAEQMPQLAEAVLRFLSVPMQHRHLDRKISAFIQVALAASSTTRDTTSLRHSLSEAVKHGAGREELIEVLTLTSILGAHAATVNVPLLIDALTASDPELMSGERDSARQEIRDRYITGRRYWDGFREVFGEFVDGLLFLDPEFFEAFVELSAVPWTDGPLEPKIKELIYVAIDVAPTHLYPAGARFHIKNALSFGATPGEVLEVIELAAAGGMRTLEIGLPLLDEIITE